MKGVQSTVHNGNHNASLLRAGMLEKQEGWSAQERCLEDLTQSGLGIRKKQDSPTEDLNTAFIWKEGSSGSDLVT